jgi:hypothetical protein
VAKTAARTVQAYANNKLGQAGQQFVTQLIQKIDPYLPRSNNPSIVNTYPEKLKQYFASAVKITDALQAQTVQVSSKQLNDPAQLYLVREPTTNNLYVKKGAGGWGLWTGADWNTEWNKTTPVQANDTKTLNQIEKLVQKGEYRAVTTPQTPSLNTNPAATYNMPRQNIPVTPRNIP